MPHAGTATAMRISLTIELITIGLVRGDSVAVGASGSQSAQIQASMSGWPVLATICSSSATCPTAGGPPHATHERGWRR